MSNNDSIYLSRQWKEFSDFIEHDGKGMSILAESPTMRLIEAVKKLNLTDIVNAIKEGAQITGANFNLLDYIVTKGEKKKLDDDVTLATADNYGRIITNRRESNVKILDICMHLVKNHADLVTPKIMKKLLMLPYATETFTNTCIALVTKESRDNSTPMGLQILQDVCKFELKFESLPIALLGSLESHNKKAKRIENGPGSDEDEYRNYHSYHRWYCDSYDEKKYSPEIIEYGNVLIAANDLRKGQFYLYYSGLS